jgi:TolB protein
MTTESFDRRLTSWLEADARGRVPGHLIEVLVRTGATRQRSAWSSLERWLPVDLSKTSMSAAFGRTGRIIALVALLAVAAAAVYLVAGGSRSTLIAPTTSPISTSTAPASPAPTPPAASLTLPDVFGPARNGLLVYASAGDIRAFDPATSRVTTIVAGPEADQYPTVSPDGRSIVFDRSLPGEKHQMMLVAIDGAGLRTLGDPTNGFDNVAWSPDATRVAMDSDIDGVVAIRIVSLHGTTTDVLPHDATTQLSIVNEVRWLADGASLIFRGWKPERSFFGIWTVNADGTNLRQVLAGTARETSAISLSPDRKTVAFAFFDEGRIRLVDVASGVERPVTFDGSAAGDFYPTWSPDGSSLAFQRTGSFDVARVMVGSPTGGAVVETGPKFTASKRPTIEFSPDGSKLLAFDPLRTGQEIWILDIAGGPGEQVPITVSGLPSWQRLAP